MKQEYADLLVKSRDRHPVIKRQLTHLAKFENKNFDHVVHDYHDEVFAQINCLECSNCCRTLGPRFGPSDIKRVCKVIGEKEKIFTEHSLKLDEDELDYTLRKLPCPFVEDDHSCNIYPDRPRHCEDFPFTTERGMQRKLHRLVTNTLICPGAYLIAEKIIDRYSKDTGE